MADVSMLDTEARYRVELTDADGDGTYTGSHTISAKNGADNGTHTITVTAMDNAGNNSEMATAMVTLQNDHLLHLDGNGKSQSVPHAVRRCRNRHCRRSEGSAWRETM